MKPSGKGELVERTERSVKQQKMTMQDYLEALGKTEEQYREELKPTAEIRLKRGLALNEIIKREILSVSDEEVEQQIDRMAAAYGPQSKDAQYALAAAESQRGQDRPVDAGGHEALDGDLQGRGRQSGRGTGGRLKPINL